MSGLMCPHCGAITSFQPLRIYGYGIIERHSTPESLTFDKVSMDAVTQDKPGQDTYAILACQACEKRFVAEEKYGEW